MAFATDCGFFTKADERESAAMATEQDSEKRVNLLLISAPWASPERPSIQLATLKAYINRQPDLADIPVRILSAHFGILAEAAGDDFLTLYQCTEPYGEAFYQLLYYKEFALPGTAFDAAAWQEGIADLADAENDAAQIRKTLDALGEGTESYVRQHILPALSPQSRNAVGFTLNFHQVYASLFIMGLIRKYAPEADVTFLLGGQSVSIPRVRRQIRRMNVSAYCFLGEGEMKLAAFLTAFQKSTQVPVIGDDGPTIPGVFHTSTTRVIDHRTSKVFQIPHLEALPPPCYDDYFEELRGYADSEEIFVKLKDLAIVMMEGSRGCFAKCDFCGFNANWTGFRKLEGRMIAEMAEQLAAKYRCRAVFYADNVCDTWAEEFATRMLTRRNNLQGYMEIRAHHPESFWTRLKLAGIETIQVGVEALSAALIRKMRKGTTLMQNLRAQKYISELHIGSGANIITHHPKSTMQDVADTKALLTLIPHFQVFNMSRFSVTIGSPIYEELSDQDKRIVDDSLCVRRFGNQLNAHELDWRYELPPALRLAPEIERTWDEFRVWFQQFNADNEVRAAQMSTWRLGSAVLVLDLRFDAPREYVLEGLRADVFDICHAGPTLAEIRERLGCDEQALTEILGQLCYQNLLVETEGRFLSLALRPEAALVANLYLATNRSVNDVGHLTSRVAETKHAFS